MNSCHGGLGDLPSWILREGIHQVVSPITGTSDYARERNAESQTTEGSNSI